MLLLGLLPVLEGLFDLHLKIVEVHHVLLDLVWRKLNEHTSDLRSELGSLGVNIS